MAVAADPEPGGRLLKDGDLEFRTKSVEEALAPLIEQVTTLSAYESSKRISGKLHKVSKLVQIVDKATKNFVAVGEEIASENPEFQEELLLACDEVRAAGEVMHQAASEFARDTFQTERRDEMRKASRELLMSVTRLMVIADSVDVKKLLKASSRIEEKLRALREAKDEEDLMNKIRECAPDIANITQLATLRQNDLKSEASQQLLVAAQTELNQASRMLISTSKTFLQHRDLMSAEENRDYVITQMLEALRTISLLADGEDPDNLEFGIGRATPGELATSFSQFEEALDQSALAAMATSDPSSFHAQLQLGMERILSVAAKLADSESTRDYHQHSLISQCNGVKERLQKLLTALKRIGGDGVEGVEGEEDWERVISECVTDVGEKVVELRKELCHAMVDHVSDGFVDVATPLVLLCEAAQEGDRQLVEERAEMFVEHAKQLEKVAMLACSLSEDVPGIRVVRVAIKYIRTLRPQVVNAARTLAAQPDSHVAQKNMAVFRETWLENVRLLTDTVDVIVPLHDFLAITEAHIREDSQQFLQAVENCDSDALRHTVFVIRGRCSRLGQVVKADVGDNPDRYGRDQLHQIEAAMKQLRERSLSWFYDLASKATDTLHSSHGSKRVNTQALGEALQKVNDDVRNVRRSVLFARTPNMLEGELDLDELLHPPPPLTLTSSPSLLSQISTGSSTTATPTRKFQRTPRHSTVFDAEDTTRAVMAQLSAEQQSKLAKKAEELSMEQERLETEVSKWDASQNDIVVLAKDMCMMMMEMSDFTRGLGSLRTTMDVIVTAKDIARAGEILDEQARTIAEQCPDEKCRKDLLAYLERIQLYCKQLKITSAVKADFKTSSTETVDNASALITAAKNLMTAVVLTVKACYVASTAIARMGGTIPEQVVQWRMTVPRKKHLYQAEQSSEMTSWSSTQKSPYSLSPIHQLGEFKPGRGLGASGHVQHRRYENVGRSERRPP